MRFYKKASLAGSIKQVSSKPVIELSEIQIEKLNNYGEMLLAVIAISGVLTVAAVIPGAFAAFKIFQKIHLRKKFNYQEKTLKITKTFYYLKRKGYIKTYFEQNGLKIIITEKGKNRINKLKYESLSIPKPHHWDRKFWQVAADIPTKHRNAADAFRWKIKNLGLLSLQRTLWFYPFDPRKEIELISNYHNISPFVTVMRIDRLDPADERTIKEYFVKKEIIQY